MNRKTQIAAITAAMILGACSGAVSPSAESEAALSEDMLAPDPMLPSGEIDDAIGTDIP